MEMLPTKLNCEQCPLQGLPYVPWQYPPEYSMEMQWPVLFVGQAPGGTEGITKVPFTGSAGKMFWRLLKEAGLNKKQLCITNLVSCPPPGDRLPTKFEIDLCSSRLKEEILFLRPELIIALGGQALEALTGEKGVQKLRGTYFPLATQWEFSCPVLTCLHPSFVMRQRQFIPGAIKDLTQVQTFFLQGIVKEEKPHFILEPSISELQDYLSRSQEYTAFDLETTGLNPRKDKTLGISFCNSPMSAIGCSLSENDPRREVIATFLQDKKTLKCAQNGLFDLAFLSQRGIEVEGLSFDTHVAEKLLASDLPADLQTLRHKYTNIGVYKPSYKVMQTQDQDKTLSICCMDSLTTWRTMQEQKKELTLKEENLMKTLLLPLIPCLNYMERRGVLVDTDTLAGLYGQMYPLKVLLEKEFEPLGINPGSPPQICKYFNLADSESKTLVYNIRRHHPESLWFQKILDFRGYQKAMGTYLKGLYNRLEEGRVHTKFKFGTCTGRLTSEDPNLQNVPKSLRSIYIPDSSEYLFLSLDFKQLELRVLALVAGITSLLNALSSGRDPHEELRKIIYGGEETGNQRSITKATLFGTAYGRSPRSIGLQFGISDAEAKRWQVACIYKYPEVGQYRDKIQKDLETKGFVETPFGRRRYNLNTRQGYNAPIQGTAGDINNKTLLKLYKKGFDVRLTIHDENVIQITKNHWKEEVSEAIKLVEAPFDELDNYSFPVKASIGPNWGELKEVKV